MKLCKTFFFGCMLWCATTIAQNDSINRLEAVQLIADKYLKKEVVGQKIISITKESIKRNSTNATEMLRFNSPIAIRDYGNGGTSSARFRGTSASNTAVLWNGVNINSVGNGQTDLNSLSIGISDEIEIKSGGGSVKYGSGAIGGSIHLNDQLVFKNHVSGSIYIEYSSFNTRSNLVSIHTGTKKWALKLASTYNQSDNDYEFIDTRYPGTKNENGAYKNYGINFAIGYKISSYNKLSFYSTGYYGDRLLSGELPNPIAANDKYLDFNQRNLLVWDYKKGLLNHVFKGAYLSQEYRYFDDKTSVSYDFGKSETYLFNYDLRYKIQPQTSLNLFVDLQDIYGQTNSISIKNRKQAAITLGVKTELVEKLETNLEFKQEFNSDYNVPFVFSLGNEFKINKEHRLLLNISNNYRVPTYNDLFWPGQGNSDLVPETSKQVDIGYQLSYSNLLVKTTLFFINVDDKIVWTPNGDENRPGVWVPINLSKTSHSGLELYGKVKKEWLGLNFSAQGNYIYTIAKDETTNKELIFVPKHLFNMVLNTGYKDFTVYIKNLTQSGVFTTADNLKSLATYLEGFSIFDIGFKRRLYKNDGAKLTIGLGCKNVFNQVYYFSNLRPMPGRNYNININYKF
ncbi:TonB-dependent receptor plug domain-containing protein [Wenyingzhuangia sp. IMCC45574]